MPGQRHLARRKTSEVIADETAAELVFFQRRRLVLCGILLLLGGLWSWRFFRQPYVLVQQAEQIITTDPARAATLLEHAVSLKRGNYPHAQLLWTQALLQSHQNDEALGCFSLIAPHQKLDEDRLTLLADQAVEQQVPFLSRLALQRLLKQNPQHTQGQLKLLQLLVEQREFYSAKSLGEELTARQPELAEGWLLMAHIHEQLMNPPSAAESYREFLNLESVPQRRLFALRRMAQLSLDLGNFPVVSSCLEEVVELTDLEIADRLLQTRLWQLTGQTDAAWESVAQILAVEPENIAAIEMRGLLACDLRKEEMAEADLSRVLKAQPWNKQAHYQLALCLRRQGKEDAAEFHFAENRRLTELSLRILELQSPTENASAKEEAARLVQLIEAYEALGQQQHATQLRQQLLQGQAR